MALTERDKAILDFERSWWANPGRKDQEVRAHLELSMTRYYELLTEILADPDSLSHDPLLVRRLKRDRDRRPRDCCPPARPWRRLGDRPLGHPTGYGDDGNHGPPCRGGHIDRRTEPERP